MGEMPGGVLAVLGAVLAAGAEHDAVLELETADLQRSEKLGDRLVFGLRVDGGAGREHLRRGEVRDALGGDIADIVGGRHGNGGDGVAAKKNRFPLLEVRIGIGRDAP